MPIKYRFATPATINFTIEANSESEATMMARRYLDEDLPEDFDLLKDAHEARVYVDPPIENIRMVELTDIWT